MANVTNDLFDVYVGRAKCRSAIPRSGGHPTWGWGNPFPLRAAGSREAAVQAYETWLLAPALAPGSWPLALPLRGLVLWAHD